MFEGKSYVFCPSSGAGEKSEGHIIKKPVGSERKNFVTIILYIGLRTISPGPDWKYHCRSLSMDIL